MMSENEMIAVIQAHKEGKTIQYRPRNSHKDWRDWWNQKEILWGFGCYDYRVKPEPHYRPFKNAEEVVEAIEKHGDWLRNNVDKSWRGRILEVSDDAEILFYSRHVTFDAATTYYTFADGTPFGKLEG